MHNCLQIHTKKFGWVCKRFKSYGVKPCFYVSPDGHISTSTYYTGPNTDERVRAKVRKELFGHNYSLGVESTDTVRYALPIIQNQYYVSELKSGAKK